MKEITPLEIARRAGFAKYVERLYTLPEIEKRFWSKVDIRGENECWPWIGAKDGNALYGMFRFRGETWQAHRVAYRLYYGEFDISLNCCHHCDNPPCCNYRHLFLGTSTDNVRDAMQKGRWFKPIPQPGEQNPRHKLTEEQVKEIRRIHAMGKLNQRAIARQFGVDFHTVNLIVLRVNWKHI